MSSRLQKLDAVSLTMLFLFIHLSEQEPIKDILQAKYTSYYGDDSDYPDMSSIEAVVYFPKPKPTFSSELLAVTNRRTGEEEVSILYYCSLFYPIVLVVDSFIHDS